MSATGPLGEEMVGVEDIRVGVDLCGPVDLEEGDKDGRVSRHCQANRRCKRKSSQSLN